MPKKKPNTDGKLPSRPQPRKSTPSSTDSNTNNQPDNRRWHLLVYSPGEGLREWKYESLEDLIPNAAALVGTDTYVKVLYGVACPVVSDGEFFYVADLDAGLRPLFELPDAGRATVVSDGYLGHFVPDQTDDSADEQDQDESDDELDDDQAEQGDGDDEYYDDEDMDDFTE